MLHLNDLSLSTTHLTDFLLEQPSADELCHEIALSLSSEIASVALQLLDEVVGELKLSGRFETETHSASQNTLDFLDFGSGSLESDSFAWDAERTVFTARLTKSKKMIAVLTVELLSPLSFQAAHEFELLVGSIAAQIKLYISLRSLDLIAAPLQAVPTPVGRVKFLTDRQARIIERRKETQGKETLAQKIGISALQIEEETVKIFKNLSPEELKCVALKAIASGLTAR
jgi:hypothetical protein